MHLRGTYSAAQIKNDKAFCNNKTHLLKYLTQNFKSEP